MAWSFSGFWLIRLYCQWFVYRPQLWRGKRLETGIHYLFTGLWLALAVVFGLWVRRKMADPEKALALCFGGRVDRMLRLGGPVVAWLMDWPRLQPGRFLVNAWCLWIDLAQQPP